MRRVVCGILLLALGMAPALEAQPRPRLGAQISKRQLRKRYVAKPFNKKKKKAQKAQWGPIKRYTGAQRKTGAQKYHR
ncbi:MAG: hypothetical protein ABSF98_12585 [Bryobacteraceae bacterium]